MKLFLFFLPDNPILNFRWFRNRENDGHATYSGLQTEKIDLRRSNKVIKGQVLVSFEDRNTLQMDYLQTSFGQVRSHFKIQFESQFPFEFN